jgi:4-hydroxythreonine-4-phosphate dehydrogenase
MKPIIGITLGDPAGIGPEIVLKSLITHEEIYKRCIPVVFGSPDILSRIGKKIGLDTEIIEMDRIVPPIDAGKDKIFCYTSTKPEDLPETGKVSAEAGKIAFDTIMDSLNSVMKGEISAIATAPINKEALKKAQIPFLDHTDIFSKKTNSKNAMMLFITGKLRIFFLTTHLRFSEISSALRIDDIVLKLKNANKYLKKIGIENPKIAIAALNPHAGEGGMFGDEEIGVLTPAVTLARDKGVDVDGPIAADSVFYLCNEGKYDAVLSLYHDQGHIAAKTLNFYKTISLNMGLPFLRTSVVHGTAMEIAGKNKAVETSMAESIIYAAKYAWKPVLIDENNSEELRI